MCTALTVNPLKFGLSMFRFDNTPVADYAVLANTTPSVASDPVDTKFLIDMPVMLYRVDLNIYITLPKARITTPGDLYIVHVRNLHAVDLPTGAIGNVAFRCKVGAN